MTNYKTGILLQGRVSDWTRSIIEEYQINFPDSEIVFQTFANDISNISCDVIQSISPEPTNPYQSTVNYQIKGTQEGLKKMKADIILRTRSDLFVHNVDIFNIFLKENMLEKIMYAEQKLKKEEWEYWISDVCQLSSRKTLLDYWDNMNLHDGKANIGIEPWLTRNYVLKTKIDSRPWDSIRDEYFIAKDYHETFQIEFEKYVKFKFYQDELFYQSTLLKSH